MAGVFRSVRGWFVRWFGYRGPFEEAAFQRVVVSGQKNPWRILAIGLVAFLTVLGNASSLLFSLFLVITGTVYEVSGLTLAILVYNFVTAPIVLPLFGWMFFHANNKLADLADPYP